MRALFLILCAMRFDRASGLGSAFVTYVHTTPNERQDLSLSEFKISGSNYLFANSRVLLPTIPSKTHQRSVSQLFISCQLNRLVKFSSERRGDPEIFFRRNHLHTVQEPGTMVSHDMLLQKLSQTELGSGQIHDLLLSLSPFGDFKSGYV